MRLLMSIQSGRKLLENFLGGAGESGEEFLQRLNSQVLAGGNSQ